MSFYSCCKTFNLLQGKREKLYFEKGRQFGLDQFVRPNTKKVGKRAGIFVKQVQDHQGGSMGTIERAEGRS